jgi:hypothetical protein
MNQNKDVREHIHVIGTYNMSFMSDLITPLNSAKFASEWAFLSQEDKDSTKTRRKYWKNALSLLKTFIIEKKPSMIGLQEMNVLPKLKNMGRNARQELTGTNAIQAMLNDINKNNNHNNTNNTNTNNVDYKLISRKVVSNNAGVSIIYNTKVLGDIEGEDNSNTTNNNILIMDNPKFKGRPILMVITNKDGDKNLLLTMHGSQDPKLSTQFDKFNEFMSTNNQGLLETQIPIFLNNNNINDINELKNIFITADFNDRYDAIKYININGKNGKNVSYNGKAPKSCCYNWDSSCPETDETGKTMFEADGDGDGDGDNKTCKVPVDTKTILTPPSRGAIKNYRYKGDKVFGLYPRDDITMYRPENFQHNDNISKESDHELVYATFSEPLQESYVGGKRNTKTRSKTHNKYGKKTSTNIKSKLKKHKNKTHKRKHN